MKMDNVSKYTKKDLTDLSKYSVNEFSDLLLELKPMGIMFEKHVTAKRKFQISIKKSKYKLLSEYINTTKKVLLHCGDPEHEPYETLPYSFIHGARCKACMKRCVKFGKKQFLELLDKNGYTALSEYVNQHEEVTISCPNPDHKPYQILPNSFKKTNGVRCEYCKGTAPEQREKLFKTELEKANYTLLTPYVSLSTDVKVQCSFPSHKPKIVKPNQFIWGARCATCNRLDKLKTADEWDKERVIEDAKKYSNSTEWRLKSYLPYTLSGKKYLDCREEATEHMEYAMIKEYKKSNWTKELCIKDAKKYKNRMDWFKANRKAFECAFDSPWFGECVAHMPVPPKAIK